MKLTFERITELSCSYVFIKCADRRRASLHAHGQDVTELLNVYSM